MKSDRKDFNFISFNYKNDMIFTKVDSCFPQLNDLAQIQGNVISLSYNISTLLIG